MAETTASYPAPRSAEETSASRRIDALAGEGELGPRQGQHLGGEIDGGHLRPREPFEQLLGQRAGPRPKLEDAPNLAAAERGHRQDGLVHLVVRGHLPGE